MGMGYWGGIYLDGRCCTGILSDSLTILGT